MHIYIERERERERGPNKIATVINNQVGNELKLDEKKGNSCPSINNPSLRVHIWWQRFFKLLLSLLFYFSLDLIPSVSKALGD
jgi:hypothetical protein